MTTKHWMLLALTVMLGGFSMYLNRDWFAKDVIQISHRSRPARLFRRRPAADSPTVNPIVFLFDRRLKLTSLKVIPLSAIETNKYPHPVWDLVSDSNSVPVKDFIYGMNIRGMRPAIKGVPAEPLQPGVPYRLLVQAGRRKAQHDFLTEPAAP